MVPVTSVESDGTAYVAMRIPDPTTDQSEKARITIACIHHHHCETAATTSLASVCTVHY